MPRSWTPVVSCQLAFAFPGLLPSVSRRTSAFPACAGLSFQTTKIIFSELGHAACTLATPGFIHTLMDMHAGSLQFQWLTFTGGNLTVTCLHPLGSNIQFHNLLFDPTDLNLLDTIVIRFGTSQSPKRTRSSTAINAPAALRTCRSATSSQARYGYAALPQMAGRRVRMLSLFPLWRASARRVNSIASRLPGTNRRRFALLGGQRT